MKEIFVKDIRDQQEIIDFFMVKNIAIKTGSNKKEYLDLTLGDSTGELSGKKWDILDGEREIINSIKEGDLIKVKSQINIWQGNIQLRINKIRKALDSDNLNFGDFIKSAPEKPEDMFNYLMELIKEMEDQDFKVISAFLMEKHREKLMYYPAASKNHHAEFGGLLYHMKRMAMSAVAQCKIYTNLNRDLLVTGVIIHDMEKINEIMANEVGVSSGYSVEGQLLGHITQGIRELDKAAEALNIPREKAMMLEHMILSHHYEPEFGSPKRPMFPEAEMLHYLDIVDARMFDMEEALEKVSPGGFSEVIRMLDNRRIYKPTF